MKYLIIVLSLFPVIASAKVYFGQKFIVKSGFYKGCEGQVTRELDPASKDPSYFCDVTCKVGNVTTTMQAEIYRASEIEGK